MITWLNANSGAVNSFLTCALIVVTAVYVYFTWRLVRESVAVRENATKPVVFISLSMNENNLYCINLVIQNVGGGPAQDIRIISTSSFWADRLKSIGFYNRGISHLAPNQKLQTIWQTPQETLSP